MENLRPDSGILDLAIVGGGPAGTAAALEARRHGLRVALWERDRFPRDKVCGEFISYEALPLLQTEIPRTAARGTAIRWAEFISDTGSARRFPMPGPALGLSRRLLDAALWQAAESAGVDVHERKCVRKVRKLMVGRQQGNTWEIEPDGENVRTAKALIIACGRWWAIEGLSSPARQNSSAKGADWVGARAHFDGIPSSGDVEMYFFHGGYCGFVSVEDGACNVCCLVRRERVRECRAKGMNDFSAWLARVSHHPALKARLRGAVQISSVVTTAPVHLARRETAQGGVLIAGDALGFLDPFTGEGISTALHSGRLAAQAVAVSLAEGFGDERAAEIYGRNLARAVRRSYNIAAMARGLIRGPAWLQGLVTAPLPWMGESLVRGTRWRGKSTSSS
jgi:flavin-dependent dehydrogenase